MGRWVVIIILASAQFIMVLDTTVMNVSISQVVEDLDTSVTQVQAAITAYTLVMAAFMLTGAKLGDIIGRRRTFTIGLAVYGLGSLITALSPNVTVLIFGWSFVEGIGATMVIPAIAALTAANYQGAQRALAYGILGGIAAAGAAAGPLIGGFMTTEFSWRYVFAGETLVVLIVLTTVHRIGDAERTGPAPRLDVVGSALSALGLGLVVFGILKASSWGFVLPKGALTIGGQEITPLGFSAVPFIVLAGVGVLVGFLHWEAHMETLGRTPLLRQSLFGIGQLRSGLATLASQQLILAGTFFVIPLYLQIVLGKDALETGIAILPMSLTMIVAALVGPRMAARRSPRTVVRIGLGVLAIGLLALMGTISPELDSVDFAIAIGVFGVGIGLLASQLGNVIMSSVDETRSSEAGGLQGMAQNIGASLGTALIGAILITGLTTGFQERITANPDVPDSVAAQITDATTAGVPIVSQDQAEAALRDAGLSAAQTEAVASDYGDAQLDALKRSLFFASLLVLVAFAVSGGIPDKPMVEADEEVESDAGGGAGPEPDPAPTLRPAPPSPPATAV